jgi:hypothetical protein
MIAVALLIFVTVHAAAQTGSQSLSSNQVFGLLKDVFSYEFELSADRLNRMLKEHKLVGPDQIGQYVLDDSVGRLVVSPYLNQRSLFLRFFPRTASQIPGPVLAELIRGAKSFNLDNGDATTLALPGRDLSAGPNTGHLSEWLTFTIPTGNLVATSIHVKWDEKR